jgi:galactokinase
VLTDFRSLDVERVPCPSEAVFVVADSGVKHDLTQEYNERRARCEEAAAYFATLRDGVTHLRDVSMAELDAAREALHHLTWRRARHIVGENERVQQGRAALAAGDLAAFGRLLSESHLSSRDNFENSCPELDILVELGTSLPGSLGARLSGGGFGGISIHLVRRDEAAAYKQRLATAYELRVGREPMTMICAIGQGAELYV